MQSFYLVAEEAQKSLCYSHEVVIICYIPVVEFIKEVSCELSKKNIE